MIYTAQEMPSAGSTVLVGMSGGVDSTLTALLLKEKGCRVIGVTMSLWDSEFGSRASERRNEFVREADKHRESVDTKKKSAAKHESCFSPDEEENIEACKKFCNEQNIEYHVVDVKKQYKEKVLEYFKNEYRSGRTPNPCIMCNKNVKFGAMLEQAAASGIEYDYFCTGHYAKVVRPDAGLFGSDVRPFMIQTASDVLKDQTYFLYRVPSSVLEKVRFPLGTMKKSEVFALALEKNLEAANQEESQDFIAPEYFDELFSDKPSVPGNIIDLDGKVLGRHRGIEHYTVGQRRGLGVAVNYPVYVHSIDAKNNLVVLAPEDALYSSSLVADDFVWAGEIEPQEKIEAMVKIRLASKAVKCTVTRNDDKSWRLDFAEPQRAVAPGQSAVLYDNGVILGGGIIREAK